MKYLKLTQLAHNTMQFFLEKGDIVIDATLGNGKDALFLAAIIGKRGTLIGFDIQEQAITETKRLFDKAKKERGEIFASLEIHQKSHCQMKKILGQRKAKVIVFNLGYLPKGDKNIITQTNTTLKALKNASQVLREDGLLSITCYTGHLKGKEEAKAVEKECQSWGETWCLLKTEITNAQKAPYLLQIIKKENTKH